MEMAAAAAAAVAAAARDGDGGDNPLLERLPPLTRADCAYARCYCEENAFHLCARLAAALQAREAEPAMRVVSELELGGPRIHEEVAAGRVSALFISNARRCVPVWRQRRHQEEEGEGEEEEDEPVLWDYHVVCLVEPEPSIPPGVSGGCAVIYDLDTTLEPFPCPAAFYVQEAFQPHSPVREEFQQRFRLVPFSVLERRFASDRSHMRRPDGSWSAPPPPWPPIRGPEAGSPMTLPRFWDVVAEEEGLGTVLSLQELMRRLGMPAREDEDEEEESDG